MKNTEEQKKYFAAANTGGGFHSFFEEIFFSPKIECRYIIKGGPGTGKSSFMRRLGLVAERKGAQTEYYYCSSDTRSLDGVVIDGRLAVLDGTAPHSFDTVAPGVCDEIINLGEFWCSESLGKNAEELGRLREAKKTAYERAYKLLHSAASADGALRLLQGDFVLGGKLCAAAKRLYAGLGAKKYTGEHETRQTTAFGVYGRERFDTLERSAAKKYRLTEYYGIERAFLAELEALARADGAHCQVSRDVLDISAPSELYFPEVGTWIGIGGAENGGETVNMKRFVDGTALASVRKEYRTAERCRDCLCGLALAELERAGEAHARTESFYIASMDFERLNGYCTRFIEKIV